jgi:hypothetical protein
MTHFIIVHLELKSNTFINKRGKPRSKMKQKQYCVNKFHVCYKLSSNESMDHANLKNKDNQK